MKIATRITALTLAAVATAGTLTACVSETPAGKPSEPPVSQRISEKLHPTEESTEESTTETEDRDRFSVGDVKAKADHMAAIRRYENVEPDLINPGESMRWTYGGGSYEIVMDHPSETKSLVKGSEAVNAMYLCMDLSVRVLKAGANSGATPEEQLNTAQEKFLLPTSAKALVVPIKKDEDGKKWLGAVGSDFVSVPSEAKDDTLTVTSAGGAVTAAGDGAEYALDEDQMTVSTRRCVQEVGTDSDTGEDMGRLAEPEEDTLGWVVTTDANATTGIEYDDVPSGWLVETKTDGSAEPTETEDR